MDIAGPLLLGVDGGTESLRAGIFSPSGELLFSVASAYDTQYPHPGWAEQRPGDWWTALGDAVRGVVAAAAAAGLSTGHISALCLDTTCCTVVALGADGHPLRPALLWADMRSSAQAEAVAATGDPALTVNAGGGVAAPRVSAEWMVPKSLWLKQREPEVYEAAVTICEYQDYLNFRLTGRMVASVNNAAVRWHCSRHASTLDINLHSASVPTAPPTSLLETLGIPDLQQKWPQVFLSPGQIVGGLTAAAAAHLDLPVGLPVAQGGADAFIGMLGLGVCRPGQMALLTGSSHLQLGLVAHPMRGRGVFGTYADAIVAGCHVVEGGQTSTGSVLAWFKRTLCGPGVSYADLDREAAQVPAGCEGLVALDHFQGNRTPHTDPHSRGAFAGLTLKHRRGHLWRALLESVAFGTAVILQATGEAGFSPDSIAVAGGATHSELWLQIHADVCGVPLLLTKVSDAPMLGCAILAAVAVGVHLDIATAVSHMVHVTRVIQPDAEAHARYAQLIKSYKALYPALAPTYHSAAQAAASTAHAAAPCSAASAAATHAPVPATSTALPQNGTSSPIAATHGVQCSGSDGGGGGGGGGGDSCAGFTPCRGTGTHKNTHDHGTGEQREGHPCEPCPSSHAQPRSHDLNASGSVATQGGKPPLPLILAPSILAADFACLAADVCSVVEAGAQWVHVDMFDGTYCPNFTIGPPVVASLRKHTTAYLDCHLAVREPSKYVAAAAAAGASGCTFHIEVMPSITAAVELAARVRTLGMVPGVALAPDTDIAAVLPLIRQGAVDLVLCMTVTPGFGGQSFQEHVLSKVSQLRALFPALSIQVDGGVTQGNVGRAVLAGANIFVAGTSVFSHKSGAAAGVAQMLSAMHARV
ncbi:MAG: hypothetical protein WDW36_003602 [Sanguina aurantia]